MANSDHPAADGEIIFTISTTHFIVVEVLYAPGLTVTLGNREAALLLFAVSGEFVAVGAERHGGDDCTVLIIDAGETEALQFPRETRCVLVTPRPAAAISVASLLGTERRVRRSILRPLLRNVWLEARRNDPSARLALDGAIFTLFAQLLRLHSRGRFQGRVSRSLRLLQSAGGETVGMAELARVSGLSVHAFAHAFKEETGATFAAYRRRLRVERAKELLRQTARPAREIGVEVGFSGYSHFSRVFAQYTGMSPADYRRVHSRDS